jgi:hypothetical protein
MAYAEERILFLGNKMQEDATGQERTHFNPGHISILYLSGRTVDTPQSYIRRGQWTHLNPMSREDSKHTSILVRREQ